jgi:hypothetical protein
MRLRVNLASFPGRSPAIGPFSRRGNQATLKSSKVVDPSATLQNIRLDGVEEWNDDRDSLLVGLATCRGRQGWTISLYDVMILDAGGPWTSALAFALT